MSTLSHIMKLIRWARILARYGILHPFEHHRHIPATFRRWARFLRLWNHPASPPDYAAAFQAIGPATVKFGQSLATRPDIIGIDAARNLITLQDQLPPINVSIIRAEINDHLVGGVAANFAEFHKEPAGAASIAQVHRATTFDGQDVAVKVIRPGIVEQFLSDIETYEWAAAQIEAIGGETKRLRPRQVIATFKHWTIRELNLLREAAAASEFGDQLSSVSGFRAPQIFWDQCSSRVLTLEWIDGIKISDRKALIAAGHDPKKLAENLVLSFLQQAIENGFFHADLHQGNLIVEADGTIVAIDFGIMGRIDRKARFWLAEILYGLTVGNYDRIAEIHFEAQYVPSHHDMKDFANALRIVGEPMRGKPAHELSVGNMLEGLFAITREFDMVTQPHLLLLQKTMVMVEGVAINLWPEINMWDISGPYVKRWIRDELGPETILADRVRNDLNIIQRIPDIIRRLDDSLPRAGGAPPALPLPEIQPVLSKDNGSSSFMGHMVKAAFWVLVGGVIAYISIITFAH